MQVQKLNMHGDANALKKICQTDFICFRMYRNC